MAEQECEFVLACPMFKYFRSYAKKVYIDLYCQGDYKICKRRQLRTSGQVVPDNLLPHGGTLWSSEPG